MKEPGFLRLTRDGYDRTAVAYAERFHHYLDDKPVDQAVLAAFAGLVIAGATNRVADVGCGTGATTAIMASHGVDVFGIDLSPNMIFEARRRNAGIAFSVGSLDDLDACDGSLGGVCAWYSLVHVPDSQLSQVFAEFHRALVPGGLALLAFQVGDEPRVLTEAFGESVELTFYRRQPRCVASQLADAGLPLYMQLVREPDAGVESTPQAYLIARKQAGRQEAVAPW